MVGKYSRDPFTGLLDVYGNRIGPQGMPIPNIPVREQDEAEYQRITAKAREPEGEQCMVSVWLPNAERFAWCVLTLRPGIDAEGYEDCIQSMELLDADIDPELPDNLDLDDDDDDC